MRIRMSIKQKVMIPMVLALALTAGLLTALSVTSQNGLIENQEQEKLEQLGGILTDRINARGETSAALAASIAADPDVQKAFANRDRQGLLVALLPSYQALAKSYGASQGQFHLAPAVSFLRLHQPDKFGDDLSSFRATVLATNNEKRPIIGLEKGKGGYGIRGVVPVVYQGQQVGSFEIGMDFDKAFLQEIKKSYGADISIYLQEADSKVQTFQEENGKAKTSSFTLYASTMDKPVGIDEAVRLDAYKNGRSVITRSAEGENSFATVSMPIRDYANDVAGLAEITIRRDAALSQVSASRNISLAAGIGVLLLMGLVAWFAITRMVVRPVRLMALSAEALSEGDVNQNVDINGTDEIAAAAGALGRTVDYMKEMASVAQAMARGDLTREVAPRSDRDSLGIAFDQMIQSLRETVTGVASSAAVVGDASKQLSNASEQAGQATQQIASTIQEVARGNQEQSSVVQDTSDSVRQLARAVDQIARGSQDQSRSIEQAAVSVAQLNQSVTQVAAASKQVAEAARQARSAATSGGETVKRTSQGMAAIKTSSGTVADRIAELDSYSEQIGSIIEAIDDIAEQTNLLALNAAIEAARAGEHGRGFAVVADEVRKLAERSSKSTKEIAGLITQVQIGTREAVSAMAVGAREVEAGFALAEDAGIALNDILKAAQAAAEQSEEIASAVAQMEAASRQVITVMDSVSAVVEESTAAAQQMAASGQEVTRSIEKVAAVTEEASASAEEVSASTEEMAAQVEEVVSLSSDLNQLASDMKMAMAAFRLRSTTGARCWEVQNCGADLRAKCPAYRSEEDRCWLIPGTWCGGAKQGDATSKRRACANCSARLAITGEEVEAAVPHR